MIIMAEKHSNCIFDGDVHYAYFMYKYTKLISFSSGCGCGFMAACLIRFITVIIMIITPANFQSMTCPITYYLLQLRISTTCNE